MKRNFFLLTGFLFSFLAVAGYQILPEQVSIGTSKPATTASLHLTGSGKGFIGNRMTTTQRDAIVSPDNGLLIYNTSANQYQYYDSSTWNAVGGGAGGISLWTTAHGYTTDNIVIQSDKIYRALADHISGTFATDLAGGKWTEVSTASDKVTKNGDTLGTSFSVGTKDAYSFTLKTNDTDRMFVNSSGVVTVGSDTSSFTLPPRSMGAFKSDLTDGSGFFNVFEDFENYYGSSSNNKGGTAYRLSLRPGDSSFTLSGNNVVLQSDGYISQPGRVNTFIASKTALSTTDASAVLDDGVGSEVSIVKSSGVIKMAKGFNVNTIQATGTDASAHVAAGVVVDTVTASGSSSSNDAYGIWLKNNISASGTSPTSRAIKSDSTALSVFAGNLQALGLSAGGTADASAILDLQSTAKGALLPRMTTTQKNAISSPATGLELYDTTIGKKFVYNGSVWKAIGGGVDPWATATAYQTNDVVIQSSKLYQAQSAHTAGTFATDLGAGKWVEIAAQGNLTGAVTSSGLATSLGSFSSTNLSTAVTDETGSGSVVFATSPTLVTPVLGVATATSINSTSIPSSKTLVVTTDKLSVHAATTSSELAGVISDETGSGALVFGTSPTITNLNAVTPTLGVATATSVNGTSIPSSKTLETKDTLTTKGDIYVATAATTTARQAVGADDTQVVADSTQTNGIAYRTTKVKGNLLANWSFEKSTVDSGWTITGGGTSATSTTNLHDGASSLIRTSTGAWTVIQDVTAFATAKSGQEAEGSIWFYSPTASADAWLCPRVNGASVTASVANGCMQYTNLGLPQKLTVLPLFGATSTGIELKGSGAIQYAIDDAYLGDRRPLVQGAATNKTTVWAPNAVQGFTLSAITAGDCMYDRIAGNLFANCKFVPTSPVASEFRFGLPSGLTIANTSLINSKKVVGYMVQGDIGAAPIVGNQFHVMADAGMTYLTAGTRSGTFTGLVNRNGNDILLGSVVYSMTVGPIPIAEWQADNNAFTTKCDDPRNCDTVFSAQVSSAGVVSAQSTGTSYPWLSGNCVVTNTAQYDCPVTTGLSTLTMSCTGISIDTAFSGINIKQDVTNSSNTNLRIRSVATSTGAAFANAFTLFCQKNGADYTSSKTTQQIVQMRGVAVNKYVAAPVHTFCDFTNNGTTFVATNASGGCSNWVSSGTREGTGYAEINVATGVFNTSYIPVCTCKPKGEGDSASSGNAIICESQLAADSSSVIRLTTRNSSTNVARDANVVISCDGIAP